MILSVLLFFGIYLQTGKHLVIPEYVIPEHVIIPDDAINL